MRHKGHYKRRTNRNMEGTQIGLPRADKEIFVDKNVPY